MERLRKNWRSAHQKFFKRCCRLSIMGFFDEPVMALKKKKKKDIFFLEYCRFFKICRFMSMMSFTRWYFLLSFLIIIVKFNHVGFLVLWFTCYCLLWMLSKILQEIAVSLFCNGCRLFLEPPNLNQKRQRDFTKKITFLFMKKKKKKEFNCKIKNKIKKKLFYDIIILTWYDGLKLFDII